MSRASVTVVTAVFFIMLTVRVWDDFPGMHRTTTFVELFLLRDHLNTFHWTSNPSMLFSSILFLTPFRFKRWQWASPMGPESFYVLLNVYHCLNTFPFYSFYTVHLLCNDSHLSSPFMSLSLGTFCLSSLVLTSPRTAIWKAVASLRLDHFR